MCTIRVVHLPEFYFGEDAVVVVMDTAGLDAFAAALNEALALGGCRIEHHGVTHQVQLHAGLADVGLGHAHVHWQLDHATVTEMIDKLSALKHSKSGHHYVDIAAPAITLVLSLNEYLDAPWLSHPVDNR